MERKKNSKLQCSENVKRKLSHCERKKKKEGRKEKYLEWKIEKEGKA